MGAVAETAVAAEKALAEPDSQAAEAPLGLALVLEPAVELPVAVLGLALAGVVLDY